MSLLMLHGLDSGRFFCVAAPSPIAQLVEKVKPCPLFVTGCLSVARRKAKTRGMVLNKRRLKSGPGRALLIER